MEICRDIANRFNGIYGDVFKMPEPYIPKVGARVMSLNHPGQQNEQVRSGPERLRVSCMEKPEDIMRKFKRAITDSDTERLRPL